MQILESSVVGLRSAVITLARRESPLRFVLFPMVHLAEQSFYDSVTERLRTYDLIVAEGIKGRAVSGSLLTSAYRFAESNDRLRLVVQKLPLNSLGVPVLWPDMTGEEFDQGWGRVPLAQRLVLSVGAPVFGLGMRLFGTREWIGSSLEMEDLPTPEDEAAEEAYGEVTNLVVDQRDALLVEALSSIHQEGSHEPVKVAVVYGAGHVPGVVNALGARFRYFPRSAEWLTVFEY